MGSKYPSLKSSDVVKRLIKLGFVLKSQRGSHAKYVRIIAGHPTKIAIVPMHDTVSKGTLQKILLQSGLSLDEFMGAV